MHTISSYRGNRPRNEHTNTPIDRTDYNTLCRSLVRRVIIYFLDGWSIKSLSLELVNNKDFL